MDVLRNLREIQVVRRRQRRQHHQNRQHLERPIRDWANPMEAYSNIQFKNKFRFKKEVVLHIILPLVADDLTPLSGPYLSPLIQLLMAFRFFASNGYQNLVGDSVTISQSTVCRMINRVARALAKHSHRFIRFPKEEEAEQVKAGFQAIANFPGVIGAIDCVHVKILKPNVRQAEVFRNRKGKFSINVQAICNSNLLFTNVVAKWPGATHDSRIFDNSRIMTILRDGAGPAGHLVGGGGYEVKSYLLPPFRNPRTDPEKRYNEAQIKTRNPIERAFGILKRRFYCLGSKLRSRLYNVLPIIMACFLLHNIGILYGDYWGDDDLTFDDEEEDEPEGDGQVDLAGEAYRLDFIEAYFA